MYANQQYIDPAILSSSFISYFSTSSIITPQRIVQEQGEYTITKYLWIHSVKDKFISC